jgi:hypothetical protein
MELDFSNVHEYNTQSHPVFAAEVGPGRLAGRLAAELGVAKGARHPAASISIAVHDNGVTAVVMRCESCKQTDNKLNGAQLQQYARI